MLIKIRKDRKFKKLQFKIIIIIISISIYQKPTKIFWIDNYYEKKFRHINVRIFKKGVYLFHTIT